MKLFIDTDVGGDFDDAHAIALALASPEIDLVGISTVGAGGSAVRRAKVAAAIVGAAGRADIPCHAGLDETRRFSADLAALQADHILNAYTDDMASLPISPRPGVDALVDAARTYGSELTVLTLCAMTNVAAAFESDGAAMRSVGRFVVMGGAFASPWREANVAIDPEAADLVLRAAPDAVRMVGYDVGAGAAIPLHDVSTAPMQTPELHDLFAAMTMRYGRAYRTERMIMCDVSACVAVLRPELFTYRRQQVAVELEGRYTRGMTIAQQDPFFNKVPDGVTVQVATAGPIDEIVALHRRRALNVRDDPS